MNWHCECEAHGTRQRTNWSTKMGSTLTKNLLNHGCMLQEVELYQKTYGKKVNECVNDEILKQGTENLSARMQICWKVVTTLWEEDKRKGDVREAIDAAKACIVEEKKVEESKSGLQTSEQCQK